jgi:hypothetical protein
LHSQFRLARRLTGTDWKRWLIVAWVVWFGFLYTKMVIKERGGKVQQAIGARSH